MCSGINHKVNESRIRVSCVHASMNREEGTRYVACSGVNGKFKAQGFKRFREVRRRSRGRMITCRHRGGLTS
jgi:hypothetical protein